MSTAKYHKIKIKMFNLNSAFPELTFLFSVITQ